MVTRRDLLMAGAAAGVVTSRLGRAFADMPAPTTAVDFDVPPGSCDCHVHVFPDAAEVTGRDPIKDIAPPLPIDDGRVLNLLPTWTADAATRHKILVENPARLYGFASA